ncbi:MAG: hypothetical protein HY814_01605 [Candidatus Riflebacteria bacterium]|nr:hypothetical protein [Candidatus Riflebacteria bacterium]
MNRALAFLALLGLLAVAGPAPSAELAYSFRTAAGGGVALLSIDEASGAVRSHQVLFEDARCALAKKVRFSADGSRVLLTIESEDKPYALLARSSGKGEPRVVELPEPCDEARAAGDHFVVTCSKGKLALVDARKGEVERVWKGHDDLKPPSSDPEDVIVADLDGESRVLATFQKDKKDGKFQGNRVAILELPKMDTIADLSLPRDRAELHLAGNSDLQGPCPEVVVALPSENAILVTLDLYGAVGIMDLDAALDGRLAHYAVLPTALDGKWGNSFPDRAARVPGPDGSQRVLVTNAGRTGGAVLIEPAARRLAATWATPPGLEAPEWVAPLSAAVAVCTGKLKFRGPDAVEKELHPRSELYLLSLGTRAGRKGTVRTFDLKAPTRAGIALRPQSIRFIVVALEAAGDDHLVVVDGANGKVTAELTASGQVQRFERRP